MKKLFKHIVFILILLFHSSMVFSQTKNKIIERPYYKGVIFDENVKLEPNDRVFRWTPSDKDIEELENKLLEFMNKQKKNKLINQGGTCPIISKNLNKYIRQYAGYVSPNGEKIIYVNCFWHEKDDSFSKGWENKLIQVFDGCSYYWQIHYNTVNKQFCGYSINGIG